MGFSSSEREIHGGLFPDSYGPSWGSFGSLPTRKRASTGPIAPPPAAVWGRTQIKSSLVFGVARKFLRPFAGTLQKILSSDWRGPRVLEAVSRAHGWLLARKPGSPPAVRGRWRAQHPRSGPRTRAARVPIHAARGRPKAVCGEKAPVPSTTLATLQGGRQSTLRRRRLTECRSHVALFE